MAKTKSKYKTFPRLDVAIGMNTLALARATEKWQGMLNFRNYKGYCDSVPRLVNTDFIILDPQTPSPGAQLVAYPQTFYIGSSITLTWGVIYATSASIDNGIGDLPIDNGIFISTGSIVVSPIVETTYTMTVEGPDGSITVTTTVNPIPIPVIECQNGDYNSAGLTSNLPYTNSGSNTSGWALVGGDPANGYNNNALFSDGSTINFSGVAYDGSAMSIGAVAAGDFQVAYDFLLYGAGGIGELTNFACFLADADLKSGWFFGNYDNTIEGQTSMNMSEVDNVELFINKSIGYDGNPPDYAWDVGSPIVNFNDWNTMVIRRVSGVWTMSVNGNLNPNSMTATVGCDDVPGILVLSYFSQGVAGTGPLFRNISVASV